MDSSFLCVIVIGLLCQVFAQEDRFHSRVWRKNLQKINQEKEDQRDRQAWLINLQKIEEDNEIAKTAELASYMTSSSLQRMENPPPPPPLMRPENLKAHLVCADKTLVSRESILRIKKGDWKDVNAKAKAWVQCVLMHTNLMTDQSVLRQDVAYKYWSGLKRKSLEAIIDKCLPTKAMPPMEISWKFAKCFQTADHEHSLF